MEALRVYMCSGGDDEGAVSLEVCACMWVGGWVGARMCLCHSATVNDYVSRLLFRTVAAIRLTAEEGPGS